MLSIQMCRLQVPIVQFPLGHSPVRNMDELAKIFPVQSCTFPQLDNSVLTIHLSFLHKKQKYTLRNHYSIATANTQRVNCKFLRSLIRQRLRLITFLGMLHFLRCILLQFIQNLMSIFLEHLAHNIHTADKYRIIFCILIIFLQ